MITRPSLTPVGIATALLLSVAACSSSSATQAPATAAPTAAPTAEPSAAPQSVPPIVLPSELASMLAPAGSAPDAKTLVTADMAASVIGGTVTQVAPPMNFPNMSVASYDNENGDSITVYVQAVPGGVMNAELQAAVAAAGAQGNFQVISGLGDAAGKSVDANDATVAFIKGSTLVAIQATSGTAAGTDLEPKVEAIAQRVASGM